MPTWTEVKEHAKSTYKIAEERDESFKLVFEYEQGRLQAVIVSHYQAMGRSWCDFSSACCRADQVSPRDMLERSFNLAVGSICLDGDVYVVRHTVQLDHMNLSDFVVPLHAVAWTANRLEHELLLAAHG